MSDEFVEEWTKRVFKYCDTEVLPNLTLVHFIDENRAYIRQLAQRLEDANTPDLMQIRIENEINARLTAHTLMKKWLNEHGGAWQPSFMVLEWGPRMQKLLWNRLVVSTIGTLKRNPPAVETTTTLTFTIERIPRKGEADTVPLGR